jgi:LmbE family N-acetylglucosaminyl deacetylase
MPDATPLPAPEPAQPLTEPPWRGRVLVVAPHPDDESAGPGGALAMHAARGDAIAAVFVTNGIHGDPTGEADPEAYVTARKAEAEAACDVLGIGAREFWGFPDGCAVTEADLAAVTAHLLDAIQRLQPDVIYAPHEGESHADHHFIGMATRRAVQQAAEQAEKRPTLVGYEVWSPQPAELVLDVTDVYESKRAAVRCYPSQLAHTDILAAIEGLNAYRSILLPHNDGRGDRMAEVYREIR